jgi:hypothetical protein
MNALKTLLITASCFALAGCGSFQLAGSVIPKTAKTQDQMNLDNLICKDKAKIEANTAARAAGSFVAGVTLVGIPVAIEAEKAKQREVYKECMETRGYVVVPPKT